MQLHFSENTSPVLCGLEPGNAQSWWSRKDGFNLVLVEGYELTFKSRSMVLS
jgi:hypothetical protein